MADPQGPNNQLDGIKGSINDLFKGGGRMDSRRIAVGLDTMLGKQADIASRIVAS
jgi:hypothetical protein